ncbi:beta-glucan synthesis-associated protein SKN1 [Pterulicium gracile]|uniref:Beta-glucan synthesis-associated protein SKN1 n=1 Tax=Pterulicium gracile TaxID=1884261 RepID=A0A5C3QDB7_9AGAR|nr:beta-glucan synthesis-associated protein SKN1 [Pterula gracilis]
MQPESPRSANPSSSLLGHDSRHSAHSGSDWDGNSPYSHSSSARASDASIVGSKFHLSPDPHEWGSTLYKDTKEPDDELHNPTRRDNGVSHNIFTFRGLMNLGCLFILVMGLVTLFAGFPLISFLTTPAQTNQGGFNLGGINATGQVPEMNNWALIDKDTPKSAYTKISLEDGSKMQLVFSDEFNKDGRTFWPGDDPFWEAHDMHYWGTNNLEWYSPEAITTSGGNLVISLLEYQIHELDYMGGFMSTWNKLCFQGGYIEASIVLPGEATVAGLWPAFWTLGNLGRAGYGASLDGMWPYSYDSCDVGTLSNQTLNGGPEAALTTGEKGNNYALSYLPGQRLSRCTCDGESHPGPKHKDGSYVGRAVPELDVIEAQVTGDPRFGHVSLTCQIAPFNSEYKWDDRPEHYTLHMGDSVHLNDYRGGALQQSVSALALTNPECYERGGGCYSEYAVEYKPGFDEGYVHWVSDGKQAWSLRGAGLGADAATNISARPIPMEPMYLILNLGMSYNFGAVDLPLLVFPMHMYVDYVRVYQRPGEVKVSCDPPDFPTAAYINTYPEAYSNPNLTTWVDDYGQANPKNRLIDQCK